MIETNTEDQESIGEMVTRCLYNVPKAQAHAQLCTMIAQEIMRPIQDEYKKLLDELKEMDMNSIRIPTEDQARCSHDITIGLSGNHSCSKCDLHGIYAELYHVRKELRNATYDNKKLKDDVIDVYNDVRTTLSCSNETDRIAQKLHNLTKDVTKNDNKRIYHC
jgi:hypothetical protein